MPKAPMQRPHTAGPPPLTREQLTRNQRRLENRVKAGLRLEQFQTEVTRRALSWGIAARLVGEAYKTADNNYRAVLQIKAAKDAQETQMWFSLLTVATSGALGWMSVAAAEVNGGLELAFEDALEATHQAMAGEIFSANGPLVFPPSGDTTVSQDPQIFQDELSNKVDLLHMQILQVFIKIRQWYLDDAPEKWDLYDEKREQAAHSQWMAKADSFAGKDDLPKVDWMAREFERGRWAKYVLANHSYYDFGIFKGPDTPDYVGEDVSKRLLKDLGVSQAAIKRLHAGDVDDWRRQTKALWDWAKGFTPRTFTDEKKKPGGGGPGHQ